MFKIVDLYDAIAEKLHMLTGYPCYYDDVPQNAVFPCFYIHLLESGNELSRGARYWRTHSFEILFFKSADGDIEDVNTEVYSFSADLFFGLEYIKLKTGEVIRGTDMSYKLVDDVLTFLVSYDFFILKEQERQESMETLTTYGGVKNGNEGHKIRNTGEGV